MAALVMLSAAVLLGLLLPSSMAYNVLHGGDKLSTGESLTEGHYTFTMESDCNLVLYDNDQAVWSLYTNGLGSNCFARLQTNGNLVIHNDNNEVVWSSNNAYPDGKYVLVMQRDGNAVIYGCQVFSTGLNTANSKGVVNIVERGRNVLHGGDRLYAGESITEGDYTFIMQSDCNLVLYDNDRAVWASDTKGRGTSCYFTLLSTGNLVIYDNDTNRFIWSSGIHGRPGTVVLILQRDGNVVSYGCPRWFARTNIVNSEGVVIVKSGRNDTSFTPKVVVPAADEPTNKKIAMVTNN